MNWEALGAIGLLVLGLGIVLFVPAMMWARHKLRKEPDRHPPLKLTGIGWTYVTTTVVLLLGGFSAQYVAPESVLGQFVSTSRGRFLYLLFLLAVSWIVETLMKARGIYLVKKE
jgi:hypothetical protein